MTSHFTITSAADLEAHYKAYIHTLNTADFSALPAYLADTIIHTERTLDKQGYRDLVPPGCQFTIDDLIADYEKREVASRLSIRIAERRLREIIFYHYDEEWRIFRAWSVVEELRDGVWGRM